MAYWDRITSRGNVEDRRSLGPTALGGGLSLAGIAVVIVLNLLTGGDAGDLLANLEQTVPTQTTDQRFAGEDSYEVFAATVLGSNNDLWRQIFAENGRTYEEPRLVLFRGATQSSCGGADAASGSHYCPLDRTIYLDETFFAEIERRFGADGGDVAEAYVIAHEVGHHAQHELGLLGVSRTAAQSVRTELQADCFAGLWAYAIRDLGVFEPGELRGVMDMAAAVGDDRIQQATTGRVSPESWTHGSSEERQAWFTRGAEGGSVAACSVPA